jgi:hypothetical protein
MFWDFFYAKLGPDPLRLDQTFVATKQPIWISGHSRAFQQCLLYPQKRTLGVSRVMSALCQKRTWRTLFDDSRN